MAYGRTGSIATGPLLRDHAHQGQRVAIGVEKLTELKAMRLGFLHHLRLVYEPHATRLERRSQRVDVRRVKVHKRTSDGLVLVVGKTNHQPQALELEEQHAGRLEEQRKAKRVAIKRPR